MVMQNKALICAFYVLINSQYTSKMHANKQLVNSENFTLTFIHSEKCIKMSLFTNSLV